MIRRTIAAAAVGAAVAVGGAGGSLAQPSTQVIDQALIAEMREGVQTPVAAIILRAQNKKYAQLGEAEIAGLDERWRAETKSDEQPLIAQLFGNPLSAHLTRIQADSDGLYTEIIVMDAHGLNAGLSAISSDFWQGDEAKWLKTFKQGPDAVFVDEAEFHDETKTWRAQVNFTLKDPDSGAALGAATVEVNLTELDRRKARSL